MSQFLKHDLIFLTYEFAVYNQTESINYRDFKIINYAELEVDILQFQWNDIFELNNCL